MDPPSSNLDDRFISYKRSSSRVWSCPKCLDRRAFHRENELFTHVAQHHPEFAEGSRDDDDSIRTIPGEGGGELTRPASGSKRLFNPTTDNPNLRSDVVKGLDPANLAPAAAAMAPRVYDKQAHVFRSKKEPQRRKDIRPRDMFPAIPPKQAAQVHAPQSREGGGRSVLVGSPTQPHGEQVYSEKNLGLVLQPETRPISQEQLVAEVKGIYAGLVMVEAKCVDVDNKQARDAQEAGPGKQPKLNNEQWQALIALHRTLLHEHHDFFLASQHRSASPALRRLASKYAMPARMWRHGIHSFLELHRHRLPDSLEHMLAFIYSAYSMMALLYETVPTFEDTWIECLGDLGRYRMAIEDDCIEDREVWTRVARFWCSKAADKSPTVGRLYHHLAILARPNALQQLYYYTRSLSCVQPFLGDTNLSLSQLDVFWLMVNTPAWHVVAPNSVITEQSGLSWILNSVGRDAATALEASAYGAAAVTAPMVGSVIPPAKKCILGKVMAGITKAMPCRPIRWAIRKIADPLRSVVAMKVALFLMPGRVLSSELKSHSPGNAGRGQLIGSSFPDWLYSLTCLFLVIYSCIGNFYSDRVYFRINWGVMTAIVDLAWMMVVLDGTLSSSAKWTTLLLGAFYTLVYGIKSFKAHRMGHGYALATISTIGLLNLMAVALPNQEGMGSKDRLTQLLLPSVGFSVSVWAYVASKLTNYHHSPSGRDPGSIV
ncbi:hypothetical protein FGG08_002259 [Glutinoglossum americanum]|uniref:DNA/RNA-binding domain-containing protein n=1 Tax=Glutinoglossum americanum TaxID=1670608 RepID=A0A9P8I0G5_9PEZI|nr:hypothetical protein FGG08_002259 [Glutinoglossum americanum]